MRGSLLLAVVSFSLASCHLQLLLDGQGFACESDDNCLEGQRCVAESCVSAEQMDAALAPDGAVTGDAAARPDSAATPDTAATPDSVATPDSAATPDTAATPDRAVATDAAASDRAPSDSATLDVSVDVDAGTSGWPIRGETKPIFLAVDDSHLYWTSYANNGALRRVVKSGGVATTVTSAPSGKPFSLALSAGKVFFVEENGSGSVDSVRVANKADLTTSSEIVAGEIIDPTNMTNVLWVQGGFLYWSSSMHSSNLNIHRYVIGSSPPDITRTSSDSSFPYGMGILDGKIFFAKNVGDLVSLPADFAAGQALTTLTAINGQLFASAANSTHLFLAKAHKTVGSEPGKILRVSTAGAVDTLLAEVSPGDAAADVWAMAADDSALYYTVARHGLTVGKVFRLLASSTGVELVAEGDDPAGVALDAEYVYWSDFGDGSIHRLAR